MKPTVATFTVVEPFDALLLELGPLLDAVPVRPPQGHQGERV
jgi:hypothetical protein